MPSDKTNYAQSLMHMIKGNLGTGILAMPASFAHAGLLNATLGLPFLCLISTYCVHLLVKSSQQLEGKSKAPISFKYASLAKHAFKSGPGWMRASSVGMGKLVDGILLVAQIGVCCVYLVFVVDNLTSILASFKVTVAKTLVFFAIFPIALLLTYIRTLKRLAICSAAANFLQTLGISFILEYLIRGLGSVQLAERGAEKARPWSELALGFGSAMFAFEGISVVLPVYTRMKNQEQMSNFTGVINVSYFLLLVLNFVMGLFGYLKFGHQARDSITLNLPPEPIYDAVRAMFGVAVFLSYPLQFYVPNEIIWNWAKRNLLIELVAEAEAEADAADLSAATAVARAIHHQVGVIPAIKVTDKQLQQQQLQQQQEQQQQRQQQPPATLESSESSTQAGQCPNEPPTRVHSNNDSSNQKQQQQQQRRQATKRLVRFEYCCRTLLVLVTFVLAISVPKLNLLMDLIGSVTGTTLSLILPAIIHLAAFWETNRGLKRTTLLLLDFIIILVGLIAGASGSVFSLSSIVASFNN